MPLRTEHCQFSSVGTSQGLQIHASLLRSRSQSSKELQWNNHRHFHWVFTALCTVHTRCHLSLTICLWGDNSIIFISQVRKGGSIVFSHFPRISQLPSGRVMASLSLATTFFGLPTFPELRTICRAICSKYHRKSPNGWAYVQTVPLSSRWLWTNFSQRMFAEPLWCRLPGLWSILFRTLTWILAINFRDPFSQKKELNSEYLNQVIPHRSEKRWNTALHNNWNKSHKHYFRLKTPEIKSAYNMSGFK